MGDRRRDGKGKAGAGWLDAAAGALAVFATIILLAVLVYMVG